MLHTHSIIYHRRCIIFFLPVVQFPLSVSFHRCSILIYSSPTLCNLSNWRRRQDPPPLCLSLSLSLPRTTALICCITIFIDSSEGQCKLCWLKQSAVQPMYRLTFENLLRQLLWRGRGVGGVRRIEECGGNSPTCRETSATPQRD